MLLVALALATAPPAPAKTALQEMQELAYIAGRCSVWMDDATKADVEQTLVSADPRFLTIYREGVANTDKGIRFDVCQKLLNESRDRLEKMNNAVRSTARF
jgi:hypothetical protein